MTEDRLPTEAESFLFATASKEDLGSTLPPIQRVTGTLFLGVKRAGREADHSSRSSAEFKKAWSYTSTPPYIFMVWCLIKYRDFNFTFTAVLILNAPCVPLCKHLYLPLLPEQKCLKDATSP